MGKRRDPCLGVGVGHSSLAVGSGQDNGALSSLTESLERLNNKAPSLDVVWNPGVPLRCVKTEQLSEQGHI